MKNNVCLFSIVVWLMALIYRFFIVYKEHRTCGKNAYFFVKTSKKEILYYTSNLNNSKKNWLNLINSGIGQKSFPIFHTFCTILTVMVFNIIIYINVLL